MKKIILTIVVIVIGTTVKAQWTDSGSNLTTNDNIGIGTTSPETNLHIEGGPWSGIKIQNTTTSGGRGTRNQYMDGNNDGWQMYFGGHYTGQPLRFGPLSQGTYTGTTFCLLDNGRVGIGTETPQGGLHFQSTIQHGNSISDGIGFLRTLGNDYNLQITSSGGIPHLDFANQANEDYDIRLGVYNEKKLAILGGKVGIGTNSADELLHVSNGNVKFEFNSQFGNDPIIHFENEGTNADIWQSFYRWSGNTNLYWGTRFEREAGSGFKIQMAGTSALGSHSFVDALTILNNGNVGLGTSSTGTHRLAVEGSIGAREIKVEASSWSDFVFENDYELRTLEELEQHINENGHLPEIPNEAEVTENGINLGEMDAKLLQKIEELTLYLIEQNKELKSANLKIEQLQKEVSALKNE